MQDFQKKLVGVSVRVMKRERERERGFVTVKELVEVVGRWVVVAGHGCWVEVVSVSAAESRSRGAERRGEERRKEILLIGMNEISGGAT